MVSEHHAKSELAALAARAHVAYLPPRQPYILDYLTMTDILDHVTMTDITNVELSKYWECKGHDTGTPVLLAPDRDAARGEDDAQDAEHIVIGWPGAASCAATEQNARGMCTVPPSNQILTLANWVDLKTSRLPADGGPVRR